MRVYVFVFIYFIHVSIFNLTCVLFKFVIFIAFTLFIENMSIQNTENSEKENSEAKQEIKIKREVNKDKTLL